MENDTKICPLFSAANEQLMSCFGESCAWCVMVAPPIEQSPAVFSCVLPLLEERIRKKGRDIERSLDKVLNAITSEA